MSNSVQGVAHRGGSLLAPENTLAAFHNALQLFTTPLLWVSMLLN